MGNSWYYCAMVARKTGAATTLGCLVGVQNADNLSQYVGDGSSGVFAHRPTVFPGSSFAMPVLTESAAAAASSQSGSGIYVKGLPASQTGLLVPGDWVEIDGQLKRLTAQLDSDAAGLGYLQVRPEIYRGVADNTPIIVTKPLGRFTIPGVIASDNMFGLNSDYQLTMDEVYDET
jgi:hypothetical protein